MKLGISSYTFTWAVGVENYLPEERLDEKGLIHKANDLGIKLLQIADNMPLSSFSNDRLEELLQLSNQNGIELEVGANNMLPENLETYIGIAAKLQSKILRFVIDGKQFRPSPTEVVPIIRNALPELKKHNIILAIENHDRLEVADFVNILERVNSSNVGICLDCANSLGNGEGLQEVVKHLAPFAVNFHLKEVSIKRKFHMMGFDIEGKPFGEGILPLEWMLSQLPEKCKTAILEQWTPPEKILKDSIDKENIWAEKSINYLKNYFEV